MPFPKCDSYDSLPIEKTMTSYKAIKLIKPLYILHNGKVFV